MNININVKKVLDENEIYVMLSNGIVVSFKSDNTVLTNLFKNAVNASVDESVDESVDKVKVIAVVEMKTEQDIIDFAKLDYQTKQANDIYLDESYDEYVNELMICFEECVYIRYGLESNAETERSDLFVVSDAEHYIKNVEKDKLLEVVTSLY